ncbi:MAG: LysE family transporter [Nitrospirota bacterium]
MQQQGLVVFLFSAAAVSLSGALSPGPLTAAVVQQGGRSRLAGVLAALGHGVVEFPLIALGASTVFKAEGVRVAIGLAGGGYLIFLAKGLVLPTGRRSEGGEAGGASSLVSGMVLSAGNPYFLLWWATVGLTLVAGAVSFGTAGVVLFAVVHWLCDLVWLSFLSLLSHKGVRAFGAGLARKVDLVSGLVMLVFGGIFIMESVKILLP